MKHLPVLSLGLALFCCTLDGRAPAKYAPRSLTPVVFDLPGKHEALELVENGRLNFAVVYD